MILSEDCSAYIGSDGYLYTNGQYWGSSNTYTKQTNAGTNIAGYEISQSGAIVLYNDGTVKVATAGTGVRTWATVSINGKETGPDNRAVAVTLHSTRFILMEDGSLWYGASSSIINFTSCVVTEETALSRDGIKDLSISYQYQFILFNNGDLYRASYTNTSQTGYTLVRQNVVMFDFDNEATYLYTYNNLNQIQYGAAASVTTTTGWTTLATVADVVQIRGNYSGTTQYSGYGWLTSDGTLTTMEGTKWSTVWTGSNHTRKVSNISYFDNGDGTWAYVQAGKMYWWQAGAIDSSVSSVFSSSKSPVVNTGNSNAASFPDFSIDDMTEPFGWGLSQSSPPAVKKALVSNFY